jgi:fatty acid desaturase
MQQLRSSMLVVPLPRRHQHVIAHHAHPNDDALDADTYGNWPIIKFNPSQPYRWWISYQV